MESIHTAGMSAEGIPTHREKCARELCAFLARYSSALFRSGSTCIRLEKNVSRMARAFGMTAEMSVLPRHIHITVRDDEYKEIYTTVATIGDGPISFATNTSLSRLSWDVADGKIGFEEATSEFDSIMKPEMVPGLWLPAVVGLANAAFCRLFGGDIAAMGVVFCAAFAGFMIKQVLAEKRTDIRLAVIICSFVSAVIASGASLFSLGSTPDTAVGTSVLYLVPGIPFINSFCDMIDRHYLCAFGRLMNAVVITCCLSLGLCAGMLFMNIGMF